MAYSVATDVRLYAPQAPEGEAFTGYITAADSIVDGRLRANYDVPFSSPTPQLITNIAAKLAAAEYLKARYSAINQEPPEHANRLYKEAMDALAEILADATMLGIDLKETTVADNEQDNMLVSDTDAGVFGMGDERTWG